MTSDGRSFTAGYYTLQIDGCEDAAIIQKLEGGDIEAAIVTLPMSHDYYVKKHLGNLKYNDFSMQLGVSMSKEMSEWIQSSLDMTFLRKNGVVSVADYKLDIRNERQFTNALISEITFPKCDGSSKDPAFMSVKFSPEYTRWSKGTGKLKSKFAVKQKLFQPANFHLAIDGLDCKKIYTVDALTIKQTNVLDEVGGDRDNLREPAKVDFPNLKVVVSEETCDTWWKWHEEFVIRGVNDESHHKQGSLTYLSSNLKTSLLELDFSDIGIFKLSHDPSENNSDKIRRFTAEMYVERLKAKFLV